MVCAGPCVHRTMRTRAEIVDDTSRAAGELLERLEVALGKVDDMDVVAHARAVMSVVVGAEDREVRPLADGDLLDERHEVIGDALGILANATRRVRADRVEVAQQAHLRERRVRTRTQRASPHATNRVRSACTCVRACARAQVSAVRGWAAHIPPVIGRGNVREDLLVEQLRRAVRVGRARRERLCDGHTGGVAVDGRRGREDDVEASGVGHALDEVERALNIDLVVQQRLRDRLAHRLQPGKVDHGVDLVLREEMRQRLLVADIDLLEDRLATGELLHTAQALEVRVAQVVGHDHIVASIKQLEHRVAADVSHTASHQHRLTCVAAARESQRRRKRIARRLRMQHVRRARARQRQ